MMFAKATILLTLAATSSTAAFTLPSFVSNNRLITNNKNVVSSSRSPCPFALNMIADTFGMATDDQYAPFDKKNKEDKYYNPETEIQKYIKTPDSVKGRDNIDGTVLVSGLVKTSERTDQTIFDLLNEEESSFAFTKIVAFVNDEKFAKKRLLSRSARYTGLLDKLDFLEAGEKDALPTADQLKDVKSWVAYVDATDEDEKPLEKCTEILELVKKVDSIENVAILMVNAFDMDMDETNKMLDEFKATDNKSYSIVAVGKLEEHAEGRVPYQLNELGTVNATLTSSDVFSRDESLRLLTESLQLESGINKAYGIKEITDENSTEVKLIKGLRSAGYTRPQEIDFMIRDGAANYQKAIDDFYHGNPNGTRVWKGRNWWEAPWYEEADREMDAQLEAKIEKQKSAKQKEIEELAKEWARREYYDRTMSNTLPEGKAMTQEEFTKEVWDRALKEGDIKYRQKHSLLTDWEKDDELAIFRAQQEKKKQIIMDKAKKELADILNEDDDDDDEDDDDDKEDDDDDE